MKYLRLLLFPFSLIYGLVVIIRNWFYDAGFFKSSTFTLPVISVGNLEVGGAGKSPMTEYLIRLFKDDRRLATLSRGYGRETKGFLESRGGRVTSQESTARNQESEARRRASSAKSRENAEISKLPTEGLARQIGDEPAQFSHKFPDVTVAVCEDRVMGIRKLMPDHDLILMDDAYQHRAVTPGLSILLFDYKRVNQPHLLLPAGDMREPFSGRWRAQVIVVTKCPKALDDREQIVLAKKVKPLNYQELFFTGISYLGLQELNGNASNLVIDPDTTVFLLTGIAGAEPLAAHLAKSAGHIIHHNYPDHHTFTLKNISKLAADYKDCTAKKKLIVTTEKDAQRLDPAWFAASVCGVQIPVVVAPIQVKFLNNGGDRFDEIVTNYVRAHTAHH